VQCGSPARAGEGCVSDKNDDIKIKPFSEGGRPRKRCSLPAPRAFWGVLSRVARGVELGGSARQRLGAGLCWCGGVGGCFARVLAPAAARLTKTAPRGTPMWRPPEPLVRAPPGTSALRPPVSRKKSLTCQKHQCAPPKHLSTSIGKDMCTFLHLPVAPIDPRPLTPKLTVKHPRAPVSRCRGGTTRWRCSVRPSRTVGQTTATRL